MPVVEAKSVAEVRQNLSSNTSHLDRAGRADLQSLHPPAWDRQSARNGVGARDRVLQR